MDLYVGESDNRKPIWVHLLRLFLLIGLMVTSTGVIHQLMSDQPPKESEILEFCMDPENHAWILDKMENGALEHGLRGRFFLMIITRHGIESGHEEDFARIIGQQLMSKETL